jgi:hypothetical protein
MRVARSVVLFWQDGRYSNEEEHTLYLETRELSKRLYLHVGYVNNL